MTPDKLIRPEVLALSAYPVADAEGMVKLDAMENPYPLPEELRRKLADVLARVALNRYPEPNPRALRELIQRKMRVPTGIELLLGNGSDDLIQVLALALARPGATMMYPSPTFVMYSMNAIFSRMRAVPVPLREDFSFDADAFIARMRAENPALVFLAYPNNPTGVLYPEADVVRVIEAAPGVVVLDEAYHVFAGKTFMDALPKYPHLLVLRTVSKLGLAGIRLGYLAGAPQWLAELNKVRQV
ncbi:MAG TPA: aminotransferase class I/II-fold pyridoxal phosphate-dependent enzyme, partial [Burkholderiales bacterium]|nr:aminotransferase class I/II-fold pyridoxal phosphate-dependent enzyme [Burkholderiales bacterium]